jgi:hypothetical protein
MLICRSCFRTYGVSGTRDEHVDTKYLLSRSTHVKAIIYGSLASFNERRPTRSPREPNSIRDSSELAYRRVAVLITPINLKPALCNSSVLSTEGKYESAATMRPVLAHGKTSSFSPFVPWSRPLLVVSVRADSSSDVVTSFYRSITPLRPHALFCISQPFSGFRSIATYIGKPSSIHCPPAPYHFDIDSSTHTTSEGQKGL